MDISHELSDFVRGADVVAILTGHDEYFSLDAGVLKGLMGQERPVMVDGRNVIEAAATKWNFNVYYPGAGTFGSLLRAGGMVKRYRKENAYQ